MDTAASWLRSNAGAHDRFLLFVDEFDPHEPFDTPAPWADRYDPDWRDDRIIWPPYAVGAVERGVLSERQGRHIRANYGAKLSMIDHWFGRLLDAVDETGIADDTAIVLCTDHGHYLGERDIWGKPSVPHYEPLGRIPLLVQWPGVEPGRVDALTTSVDLHATIADLFGVTVTHRTHGRSLLPLITGETDRIREWALAGVFGRWVQIVDGRRKYARGPVREDNLPLSMWSNRWSTMPLPSVPELRLPRPDRQAVIDFMPGSDVPVLRQPFRAGGPLPYWSLGMRPGDHHCFDLEDDPGETDNRRGGPDERDLVELLRIALREVEVPPDQLERLGIA